MKATVSHSPEQTESVGEALAAELLAGGAPIVVALYGGLGAGKTAFVRGFARGLGYSGRVQSPTFAIVNEYRSGGRTILCHFDVYRLTADGLADIGWDDYLASGVPIAVEWADNAEAELPLGCVRVAISGSGDEPRVITIETEASQCR